jgi:hypothetical protein
VAVVDRDRRPPALVSWPTAVDSGEVVEEEVPMSTTTAPPALFRSSRRAERRAERRRLRRHDALSARLAELHSIRGLLERATAVVGEGWIRGAWFTVATPSGERAVTAYDLRLLRSQPVTGACLVGAVVHGGGGPGAIRSQTVQRALDLTWHTLRQGPDRAVTWCPAPQVRTMQVLDLTRWNDAPGRTQAEVVHLLTRAQGTVGAEEDRYRTEQVALDAGTLPAQVLTPASRVPSELPA